MAVNNSAIISQTLSHVRLTCTCSELHPSENQDLMLGWKQINSTCGTKGLECEAPGIVHLQIIHGATKQT